MSARSREARGDHHGDARVSTTRAGLRVQGGGVAGGEGRLLRRVEMSWDTGSREDITGLQGHWGLR